MKEIGVSIICVVYNHAEYVRDALDGFLSQKTDFEYEILLHDDASTDGTTEILQEYQGKYPEKIRLVLETENQYSKGVDIAKDIMLPYVRGKYIAYCEGDDCWIYDRKLQIQYDLMESDPEISLCYHNGLTHDLIKEELGLCVVEHRSGYLEDKDIICPARGWYPTASSFYRTVYLAEKPALDAPTGDEEMRFYMACRGRVYFINRVWCRFRRFTRGSWYEKYCTDRKTADQYNRKLVAFIKKYNEYSGRKYELLLYGRIRWNFMYYISRFHSGGFTLERFSEYVQEFKTMTDHMADDMFDQFYQLEAIHCSDYLQTVMEKRILGRITADTSVYICGAGDDALQAMVMLMQHNINIRGIVDVENGIKSDYFLSYPVYRASDFRCENNALIWLCLKNRYKEIKMLKENGYNIIY